MGVAQQLSQETILALWRNRIDYGTHVYTGVTYDDNPGQQCRTSYWFKKAAKGSHTFCGCIIEGPHEHIEEAAHVLQHHPRVMLPAAKRRAAIEAKKRAAEEREDEEAAKAGPSQKRLRIQATQVIFDGAADLFLTGHSNGNTMEE